MGKGGPKRFEVFEVVKKGKGYGLELHPTIVEAIESDKRAKTHITSIENLLNVATKQGKTHGMSAAEQKALWHSMKAKWEAELDYNFKLNFKVEKNPLKLARMLTNEIFKKVNMTIGTKLKEYASKVEGAVSGDLDKQELKAALAAVGQHITDKEAEKLWKHASATARKERGKRGKKAEKVTAADVRDHKKGMR